MNTKITITLINQFLEMAMAENWSARFTLDQLKLVAMGVTDSRLHDSTLMLLDC